MSLLINGGLSSYCMDSLGTNSSLSLVDTGFVVVLDPSVDVIWFVTVSYAILIY